MSSYSDIVSDGGMDPRMGLGDVLRMTSDKAATVNPSQKWLKITPTNRPAIGASVLLINRPAGVAQVAKFKDDGWYTHFAGLPVFGEEE